MTGFTETATKPTGSAIKYQIEAVDATTNLFVITSRQTSSGGSAGQAGAGTIWVEITGFLTTTGAGNLTIQFSQNSATPATTSSVLTGSQLLVFAVT